MKKLLCISLLLIIVSSIIPHKTLTNDIADVGVTVGVEAAEKKLDDDIDETETDLEEEEYTERF